MSLKIFFFDGNLLCIRKNCINDKILSKNLLLGKLSRKNLNKVLLIFIFLNISYLEVLILEPNNCYFFKILRNTKANDILKFIKRYPIVKNNRTSGK